MKILGWAGRDDIAIVYIADMGNGRLVEFVESVQPPFPREEKWVLIVSTLFGCPIKCLMCDACEDYKGKLSADEIFQQIDFLVRKRFPDRKIPSKKFKIQFARLGEPALNDAVLDVLDELPSFVHAPGLIPSVSTIAPASSKKFFERLLEIKNRKFSNGHFQLQFSIHTTDEKLRDELIPVKKWSYKEISDYCDEFFSPGDRKISLNFALANGMPIAPYVLCRYFTPEKFLIKITPVNPTHSAVENRLTSYIDPFDTKREYDVVTNLRSLGYEVIVSIGEVEENKIGSNCGQYVMKHLRRSKTIKSSYTYKLENNV